MGLLHLFKKRPHYGDYQSSSIASTYEMIAFGLNSNAQHVYEIAHGKPVKCHDDYVVYDRLCQYGIIRRF